MKKPRFTERKRRHRVDSWRGGSHTALVLAAVLLAGCAIQNTPQQERTWAAYEALQGRGARSSWAYLEPDGRWWWVASGSLYGVVVSVPDRIVRVKRARETSVVFPRPPFTAPWVPGVGAARKAWSPTRSMPSLCP